MKLVMTLVVLLIISCSNDKELRPVDINYGQDICERCKMIISEEKFSSQLIMQNGTVYNFDDIGGMIVYILENEITPEKEKIFVKDFYSNKWLGLSDAIYVSIDNIKTPMNFGLVAVADSSTASDLISKHGGRVTGSYLDTVKYIKSKK